MRSATFTVPADKLEALAADPDVEYISPDRPVFASLDYATPTVAADIATEYGYDGAGIGVAVVDSGIAFHLDVNDRVIYSESFVKGNADDQFGHGTHVAGIVAGSSRATQDSAVSFRGIAPKAHLVNLRVLDRNGVGTESGVIEAIQRAIELKDKYNIRVINLSLDRPVFESYTADPLCQAVEAAWNAGIGVCTLLPRPQHIACGAVEDYPRTLEEFEGRFATEQACREYLMQLRWPQGFVCPRCGGRRARPSRRGLLRCGQCDYQASVTAGTIFQDTRLPLRTWFRTMWWVTSQKNGVSALGLQSILGLGSYRTAWALLHKLRRAMVRPGRERLSGRVEVDETYVGGAEEGLRGRQTQKKALVAIAAEEDGAGIGRIRMKRIREASKQQLHGFIQEAVEPDSTIHTDGWEGYVGLEALGYRHEYDFLAGSSQSASELLPHVHRVAALLKRWLIGTHQGAVSREHLDYYLDEYTFRFNRRRSRHRGKLFYRLVQQAATVGPTTYSEMV